MLQRTSSMVYLGLDEILVLKDEQSKLIMSKLHGFKHMLSNQKEHFKHALSDHQKGHIYFPLSALGPHKLPV